MTEYWKSQARKYCEFCKCWLADNKVSISFHENGKRHKENVQKHISQLSKKSAKDFKQKEKMDDDIRKMEAAAMASYLKDIQNNADMTSQSINNILSEGNTCNAVDEESNTPIVASKHSKIVWHEAKSDNGNYFWNTETNETTWDPPDEYLSIAEQEQQEIRDKEKVKKKEKNEEKIKKQKQKEAYKELNAHMAREKMKELAVKKEEKPPISFTMGPAARPAAPYGTWKTVVTEPVKPADLQLPKVVEKPPASLVMQPEEKVRFKERTVDSLGDGPVEFKKRKFNNPKRNVRQKLDDE